MEVGASVSEQPELLILSDGESPMSSVAPGLFSHYRLTEVNSVAEAISRLTGPNPPEYCLVPGHSNSITETIDCASLLAQLPDAVLKIDQYEQIVWANRAAHRLLNIPVNGEVSLPKLFDLWSQAQIVGPDFCPVNSVMATGKQAKTTVRLDEKSFFEFTVTPIPGNSPSGGKLLLATLRETSDEVLQQQKLDAVHQAGLDLGDLDREDVLDLSTHERVELLKSKLLYYTQELLEFDTVEIRIVDQETGHLKPLLDFGMDPTAATRELLASPQGNGVTGFVASTGKSYLCEDTTNDPLYLPGAAGAKSSLTVPLIRHDLILGTFNVESPQPGAFTATDLRFVELFCREVAIALNTLELLEVEKETSIAASTKRMLCEVADPVDEILSDTCWMFERFSAGDSETSDRIRRILNHTQDIRKLIRDNSVNCNAESVRSPKLGNAHPHLIGKRVLVVDMDVEVRKSAHEIMEQYDMTVDAVRTADEALRMVRTFAYHVVIADKSPPDMKGSEMFRSLREIHEHLPIMLMTGFGYDGEHTLVKCREMGMRKTLYKPFIVDQLIKSIEDAISNSTGSVTL